MSLQFNDTTNKSGIVQIIEDKLKFDDGYITGNVLRFKKWTAKINLALDKVFSVIFKSSGKWQFDDSNHEKYPFIETDLVANQRDYAFTTDQQGNIILDIYKVMAKNPDGVYYELTPVDQQSDSGTESFWDSQNTTGIPTQYDKTANGIILDVLPSYSWRIANELERGLKVFINREGSYFAITDTTKKPGFSGLFHKYLVTEPCYNYACDNGLPSKNDLKTELLELERDIKEHYRDRAKDETLVISGETVNYV